MYYTTTFLNRITMPTTMLEKNLSNLGFSPSEIKIYIYLLKTGSNYANRVSSETKINRTNVYEALDRLVNKGVVSFISRNKVKWFEAKEPESIISLIRNKEEDFVKTKKELTEELKQLKNLIGIDKKSLEANVFVGKKGLRILFDDMLEIKKPVSLIAAKTHRFKEVMGPYFDLWHRLRAKKCITQRSLVPKSFGKKLETKKLLRYKYLDEKAVNPTTTIIYGDNCLFVQWVKEPIAIKINNKEISKSHQNYFDMLWKNSKV